MTEVDAAADQAVGIVFDLESGRGECIAVLGIRPQRDTMRLDPLFHTRPAITS